MAPTISNSSTSDHLSSHFSTSPTNGPRLLSQAKVGTHPALLKESHTTAHTAKHGAFRMGVVSLPSERSTRFGNPAWPGFKTAYFAAFGSWSDVLLKNAESLGTAMRSCVSLFRGVAAPLGCVIFFYFCQNCDFYALRTQSLSVCARRGWYHYPRCALCAVETLGARLSK